MTNNKSHHLVSLKKYEKHETQRAILRSMRKLGESSSSEIHDDIIKGYKHETKEHIWDDINFAGIEVKRSRKVKKVKNFISLRTVQRNLRDLCEDGLVKESRKLYSLADEVRAARYFGKQFGARVLHNVIPMPDYELRSVKENLQNLITLFGTIITFCCMEASRPNKNSTFSKDEQPNNLGELASTMSWINSIISPSSLFHYFLFIFRNQVDDDIITKLKKVDFDDFYSHKPGKRTLTDKKTGEERVVFPILDTRPVYIDDKGERHPIKTHTDIPFDDKYLPLDRFGIMADYGNVPYDEIDYKTYNRMVQAFRELDPKLSAKLEELRMDEKHILDFKEDVK